MEYFDLSVPQQNIWNLQNYYKDSAVANLCGVVFFEQYHEIEILKKSINLMIQRQTALRLRFKYVQSQPKQYINEYSYVDIPVQTFENYQEFEKYAEGIAIEPIGLLERNMAYFELVTVGGKQGVLARLSHMISDAWTFSLLVKEVEASYQSLLEGIEENAEIVDYSQYIEAEKKYFVSPQYEKDVSYWQNKYRIKPATTAIKAGILKSDIRAKRVSRRMAQELVDNLRHYCKDNSVTPAVLFEAALYIYLHKVNANNNVTIGLPILNRFSSDKRKMGMFVSTMPLTIDISEDESVVALITDIKSMHMQLFRHCKYPYSRIMGDIRKTHDFEGRMYDVMFSFQNAQSDVASTTKWFGNGCSEVPFVLHVDNRDSDDTYTLTVDYQITVFAEDEVVLLLNRIEYVLGQILNEPSVQLKDVFIVPEEEKRRLLYDFNDTFVDYPRDKCVHELFMEQAARTPEAVAVVFEDKQITYKELDEMSNALAHILQEKGVERGDIVPLIANRSYYIPVAMLGILKAGGAYMPIAPDYPKDRVQFMVQEAKSKVGCVLGYEEQLENIELLRLDELVLEEAEAIRRQLVECINDAENLCYVIFTSGSTGVPKGILLSHKTITNLVYWQQISGVLEGSKHVLSVTSVIFDVFTQEVFSTILSGRTLFLINDDIKNNVLNLKQYATEVNADTLYCTPSYYKVATRQEPLGVDKVILAGESFSVNRNVQDETIAYYNQYGPAETHVVTCSKINAHNDITIGKPIANTQIYILDSNSNPVPIGVPGELCIAGEGVGKGYLNRPELTAERFVSNPFATESNGHGKIMYHTGDLAAWRENGEIEYLGRIDTQVKIRGLRIELGEIESVMSRFPGIRMCAVTDKKDEEGRQYLVGYYTTASDEQDNQNLMTAVHIDEKELRKHLSAKLPKYMVPNFFIHLEKIPMTPSGKTDRKNLPIPGDIRNDFAEYVAPVTETEKKLCQAMEAVLGYSPMGQKHDFFEYGGDSLKAMELIIKLEELGYRVSLQDIFEYPSVSELAERLQNEKLDDIRLEYLSDRFEKYEPLLERNKVKDNHCPKEVSVKTVLLSGITGFLGAHIADALLQDEECVIYCLVRSKSSEDRRGRFPEILEYYFGDKYKESIGSRIIPVVGDITDEKLSKELPEKVDMVIHAAATVKHYGDYEYFYRVNTLGTKHMADYAQRVGAKFIHISTISVSGNSLADSFDTEVALEEREFGEDCLYQEQDLKNVYVRSKFEAECVVLDAMLQGLQANIIRVGNLTNRSRDYVFQPNYKENAFLSRIKAAMELGFLPDYMLPLYAEFSPVDDTAQAIVKIARHFHMEHTVYHVYSNQNLYFDRLLEILKELGISMSVVSGAKFAKKLRTTVSENRSHIYEAFLNDMSEDGRLQYDTNIHILNDFTIDYLKQLGFAWTKIDYEYVRGYIEYFKKLGYLEV